MIEWLRHYWLEAKDNLILRLGGLPMRHSRIRKWRDEEYDRSLAHMRATAEKSDKVFMEPVTLVGDNQTIANSVFFGSREGGWAVLHLTPKGKENAVFSTKSKCD